MSSARILQGDCRWYMQRFSRHVGAIVTDPPYHLSDASRNGSPRVPGSGPFGRHRIGERGFMGKTWDGGGVAFDPRTWQLALQVLKPGGRLLAFGAPRTHHRIWCAIEDAGFVIEDTVSWLFGSGFPKHKSKLKPFAEFICVARKGPVTALNIDAARIGTGADKDDERWYSWARGPSVLQESGGMNTPGRVAPRPEATIGRWPPNVAMDESAAEMLDAQTGTLASGNHPAKRRGIGFTESTGGQNAGTNGERRSTDSGGASRFLYVAKASRAEREQGLEGMPRRAAGMMQDDAYKWPGTPEHSPHRTPPSTNAHPTVKPVALMRWLVKLVTQPGDLVLDPFAGSGTTGMACVLEGREFIGIEREPEYAAIAERRIANALGPLFADTDGAA